MSNTIVFIFDPGQTLFRRHWGQLTIATTVPRGCRRGKTGRVMLARVAYGVPTTSLDLAGAGRRHRCLPIPPSATVFAIRTDDLRFALVRAARRYVGEHSQESFNKGVFRIEIGPLADHPVRPANHDTGFVLIDEDFRAMIPERDRGALPVSFSSSSDFLKGRR